METKFSFRGPVHPTDKQKILVERQEYEDLSIHVTNGTWSAIVGPRQSGKTTLLFMLQESFKQKGYLPIYITMERYADLFKQNHENVFEKMLSDLKWVILTQLKTIKGVPVDLRQESLTEDQTYTQSSSCFIEFLVKLRTHLKSEQSNPLILLIDEYQILGEHLRSFLHLLRSIYHQIVASPKDGPPITSAVIADQLSPAQVAVINGSPYNIVKTFFLTGLCFNNTKKLMQSGINSKYQLTDEAIKTLFKLTDGQPYLLQRLGTLLKPVTTTICIDDIYHAKRNLMLNGDDHLNILAVVLNREAKKNPVIIEKLTNIIDNEGRIIASHVLVTSIGTLIEIGIIKIRKVNDIKLNERVYEFKNPIYFSFFEALREQNEPPFENVDKGWSGLKRKFLPFLYRK